VGGRKQSNSGPVSPSLHA